MCGGGAWRWEVMCGGVTEERSMVVGGDVCRRGSEGGSMVWGQ